MKLNLWQAVAILLVSFAILSAIQALVATVDTSTIPSELQGIWQGVVYVFTSGVASVGFTFLRNILGYAENKLEADPQTRGQIHYEAGLLGATLTRYTLYVYGFTAAIQTGFAGTPYQQHATVIAGAIGIILDLVIKAINDLGAKTQPVVTVTSPSP